jgi:hypothetical protein
MVLKRASQPWRPARITERNPTLPIYAALVDSGHLDGWVIVDAEGRWRAVLDPRITELGREYLEQFWDDSVKERPLMKIGKVLGRVGVSFALILVLVAFSKTRDGRARGKESSAKPPPEIVTQIGSSFRPCGVCGLPPLE